MQIPVLKKKKPSIVPIGSEETGYIYLQKRHHCVSGERMEIDEYEIKQMQGQVVLDRLARKICEDKGVNRDYAMSLIFPKEDEVASQAEDEQNILLQYPEEMEQLVSLRIPANKLKAVVATVFIQRRVAYPVQLVKAAKLNQSGLAIAPAAFHIKDGAVIKFGSCLTTALLNHDLGAETLSVEEISESLAADTVGFLYDPSTQSEIVGATEWTFEQTNDLDENLIELIYEFYQREKARLPETPLLTESSELEEGKSPSTGKKSRKQNQLNGGSSSGESNPIESPTPDSLVGKAS
ncbi:MAG: hypothetical protein F6K31_12925 [Symploca sp. SIO2G7]|nr:hypothetical protein [Symploca sp. SIO2G7]